VHLWYTSKMSQAVAQKPPSNRDRLLDLAEQLVLQKGFASTSIEELIAGVGITKSGFFYHFKDKNDLAKSLMLRYLDADRQILDDIFDRAGELHEDPLHSFLIGLKLFSEMMAKVYDVHPGCLAASICYQDQLFDQEVRTLNAEGMLVWRARFRAHLNAIAERYPPKVDVDLDTLADMMMALVEGGIILSKALKDNKALPAQITHFRNYIRLLFEPA
jgi:TetR/AcrR family transcriptional regulator, transcriptional repressor for nem operon